MSIAHKVFPQKLFREMSWDEVIKPATEDKRIWEKFTDIKRGAVSGARFAARLCAAFESVWYIEDTLVRQPAGQLSYVLALSAKTESP